MKTVFIDSSVLFSACSSLSGASAQILVLCRKKKLQGYISKYVVAECKKNIAKKLDQKAKQRLNMYLLQFDLKTVSEPTEQEIKICEEVIKSKDAPILAAAIKSKAMVLVTLDKKDFMIAKVRNHIQPTLLFTPDKFLSSLTF